MFLNDQISGQDMIPLGQFHTGDKFFHAAAVYYTPSRNSLPTHRHQSVTISFKKGNVPI